jgi:hypothetical protein
MQGRRSVLNVVEGVGKVKWSHGDPGTHTEALVQQVVASLEK